LETPNKPFERAASPLKYAASRRARAAFGRTEELSGRLRSAMLRGIFETHLDVADLERSVQFYTAGLGLELAVRRDVDAARVDTHSSGVRRFALLWVGGHGHAMMGLWERSDDRIRRSIVPSR
jgi:hypothetical protein